MLEFDEFAVGDDRLIVTKSLPASVASDTLKPPDKEVKNFLASFELAPSEVYLAAVSGGASAAFLDENPASESDPAGYQIIENVDGLFGPPELAKACWLGDCGFLLASGVSASGQLFNGFIHTTRLNLNGGIEAILRQMLAHYRPSDLKLTLAAGIASEFYVHEFASEAEIEEKFPGWQESGWLAPHKTSAKWDGKSYEANLYAAVAAQVERAGLLASYDDQHIQLDGDPASGHASHRGAARGLVNETRDLYLLMPR